MREIRRAEERDIPEIARLLYEVHDVHATGRPDLFVKGSRKYTDEQLKELLQDEKRPVFLSLEEEKTLGYIFCVLKEETDPSHVPMKTLYVDDLCVEKEARGRNVGRELYEYACTYAKALGCYNLTLNVWALNDGAQHFYEKMGMKVQKIGMEIIF